MFRVCFVAIAVALAGVAFGTSAAQAEPLVLSCKGTVASYGTDDQRSRRFVMRADFTEGTVVSEGLSAFLNGGRIIQTDGTLYFLEYRDIIRGNLDWTGATLNRATGVLEGLALTYDGVVPNQDSILGGYAFTMRCAPLGRQTF